jgi:hypothetical protein
MVDPCVTTEPTGSATEAVSVWVLDFGQSESLKGCAITSRLSRLWTALPAREAPDLRMRADEVIDRGIERPLRQI